MRVGALIVGVMVVLLGAGEARAQFICANFWPQTSGTYADLLNVTVAGATATGTQHGVTGLRLGGAGLSCTSYTLSQNVARFDFEVVDVDPGEEVFFDINNVEYPLIAENLFINPYVTAQPLMIVGGRLRSAGADGSAFTEITAFNMTRLRICGTGGDGVIVSPMINSFCQCANGNKHFNEDCDDGGTVSGDGCSATCEVETGWSCAGNPSVCVMGCGNGTVAAGEQCDDGDNLGGDGCNAVCQVEGGWNCTGTPSVCIPFCGDAQMRGMEQCDDGGMMPGDGCSMTCTVEPGWTCMGEGPGSCMMIPPIDAAIDAPIDAAIDAPIDAAVDAPIDAPIDAAIDAPIDAPDPVDAAVDAPDPVIDAPSPDAPDPADAGLDADDPSAPDPEGCCSSSRGPDLGGLLLLAIAFLVGRTRRVIRRI